MHECLFITLPYYACRQLSLNAPNDAHILTIRIKVLFLHMQAIVVAYTTIFSFFSFHSVLYVCVLHKLIQHALSSTKENLFLFF